MMDKKKDLKTYFEITISEARKWNAKDYILFILESLYTTVFPFVAGMLLVYNRNVFWLLMLVMPIYFKLRIQKSDKKEKKKKVYVK